MSPIESQVKDGYRSFDAETHDIDDHSHEVAVDFPHEVLDSFRTDWGKNCFRDSFAKQLPIMLWQHQPHEPIGRAVRAQELGDVARVVGRFSDFDAVPRARQAFAQIQDGAVPGWSFHFRNARSIPHPNTRGARRFTQADMTEFSPVSLPSIPGAKTVGLRSQGHSDPLDDELARARELLERRFGGAPSDAIVAIAENESALSGLLDEQEAWARLGDRGLRGLESPDDLRVRAELVRMRLGC